MGTYRMGETLGKRLKQLREAKEISQADLARSTGLEQTAISRIEVRQGYNPSAVVLYKIAKALGTSSDALLEGLVELRPAQPIQSNLAERFGNEIASLHKGQAELGSALSSVAKSLERVNQRLDAMDRPKVHPRR